MPSLTLPVSEDKYQVFDAISDYLKQLDIAVAGTDFSKPWGGYFVIDNNSTDRFIKAFFSNYSYEQIAHGLPLQPKILVVEPGKKLSWQYHHRRQEMWKVSVGPVGIITSDTDEQGPVRSIGSGEIVQFGTEVRHRLIGLDTFGVVAEFWKHTDSKNPSDEDDIVRVQDDFERI